MELDYVGPTMVQAGGHRSLDYPGGSGNGERKLWKLFNYKMELIDKIQKGKNHTGLSNIKSKWLAEWYKIQK